LERVRPITSVGEPEAPTHHFGELFRPSTLASTWPMDVGHVLVTRLYGPPLPSRVDEGPPPPWRLWTAGRVPVVPAVDHAEALTGSGPGDIRNVGHGDHLDRSVSVAGGRSG